MCLSVQLSVCAVCVPVRSYVRTPRRNADAKHNGRLYAYTSLENKADASL